MAENVSDAFVEIVTGLAASRGWQWVETKQALNQDAVVVVFEAGGRLIHVTASGRELRMNESAVRMVNLAGARLTSAERQSANG